MPRSSYVYVVEHSAPENPDPPHVQAAFTVKHELATWLKDRIENAEDDYDLQCVKEYTIWRIRHTRRGRPEITFIPQKELLSESKTSR